MNKQLLEWIVNIVLENDNLSIEQRKQHLAELGVKLTLVNNEVEAVHTSTNTILEI